MPPARRSPPTPSSPGPHRPGPRSTKPRNYDPARVRQALIAQVESVAEAAHALTREQLALPSGLPGWDVRHLLLHLALQIDAVPRLLAGPESPGAARTPTADTTTWVLSIGGEAARLDAEVRAEAARTEDTPAAGPAGDTAADPAARIDEAVAQLDPVLESAVRTDLLLPHPFGTLRMLDFTVTRLVELVIHADDLARATGTPVALDRQAVAASVRVLADALAAKAPGRTVEVRIPPFAVIQCVEGPRHTRGTPPNVVETDPLSWLRLASGRTAWREALAAGSVTASGQRADLEGQLPLLG